MLNQISSLEVIMTGGPLIFFIIVLEMVRRRRLREDYSLLWLGTFGALVVLSLLPIRILDYIAGLMGIHYPPVAMFVIGFGLLMVVMLQFSMVITRLAKENKSTAQHIALLNARIYELETALAARKGSDPDGG